MTTARNTIAREVQAAGFWLADQIVDFVQRQAHCLSPIMRAAARFRGYARQVRGAIASCGCDDDEARFCRHMVRGFPESPDIDCGCSCHPWVEATRIAEQYGFAYADVRMWLDSGCCEWDIRDAREQNKAPTAVRDARWASYRESA